MSHQNSGTATNGPPSLFGEVAASDSSGKAISILAAVTGKEISSSSHQKKPMPMRRLAPIFLLLILGAMGFAYWKTNGAGFGAMAVRPDVVPTAGEKLQRTIPAAPRPAVAVGQQAEPETAGQTDGAVIETVADTSTSSSVAQLSGQPDLEKPVTATTSPSGDRAAKVDAARSFALAPALQIKNGTEVTKVTERNSNPRDTKTSVQQEPTANPEPPKQQKASVARAAADPDEKLLEEMLRLMKRDSAKDNANASMTK